MSHAVERCPLCGEQLVARTNGFGVAYLDCWCGYVETITRKADPFPSVQRVYVKKDGTTRTMFSRAVPQNRGRLNDGRSKLPKRSHKKKRRAA